MEHEYFVKINTKSAHTVLPLVYFEETCEVCSDIIDYNSGTIIRGGFKTLNPCIACCYSLLHW